MPFVSQAQRGLAHAIAKGKKITGVDMTKAIARRLIAEDEPGKLPKHVKRKKPWRK